MMMKANNILTSHAWRNDSKDFFKRKDRFKKSNSMLYSRIHNPFLFRPWPFLKHVVLHRIYFGKPPTKSNCSG